MADQSTDALTDPVVPPRERRSRRGSGSITLADVAKVEGGSATTASRALNTPDCGVKDLKKRRRGWESRR